MPSQYKEFPSILHLDSTPSDILPCLLSIDRVFFLNHSNVSADIVPLNPFSVHMLDIRTFPYISTGQ